MARRGSVRVSITGDADGLGRATRDAENKLDRLNKAGGRSMRALGSAAKAGGLALGAGLAAGLTYSTKAAIDAERSQAQLKAQLDALGISYKAHADQIDRVIQKTSQLSGLDDEDLQDAFTNIVRVTGDVNKSLNLTGLAADFARAKHMDVAKAGELVGKVAGGNTGILSRYGIVLKDGATSTEALGVLQQKFAGQAKAYGETTAGSLDRAHVAAENLAETAGSALAPAIATVAGGLSDFINQMQTGTGAGGRFRQGIETAFNAVKSAIGTAVQAVRGFLQSHRQDIDNARKSVENIGHAVKAVFEGIVLPIAKRVWPAVAGYVKGAAQVIGGVIRVITGLLSGDFGKAWQGVKDIVAGSVKAVLNQIRGMTAPMREAMSRIGRIITNLVDGPINTLKGGVRLMGRAVGAVFDGIRAMLRTWIKFVLTVIDKWLAGVEAMVRVASHLPFIGGKFDGVADAIHGAREKLQGLKGELDSTPSKAGKLDPLLSKARSIKTAFDGVAQSVHNAFSELGHATLPQGDPKTSAERLLARLMPVSPGAPTSGTYRYANQVASLFGLHVTSGWRSPEHNAEVGGVPNSMHTHGSSSNPGAIDLVGPTSNMYRAAAWARAHLPVREVLVHNAGSGLHLHLGFFEQGGEVDRPMFMVGEEAPQHPEFVIATNPKYRQRNVGYLMQAAQALGIPGFAGGGQFKGKGDNTYYAPSVHEVLRFPLDKIEGEVQDASSAYGTAQGRAETATQHLKDLYRDAQRTGKDNKTARDRARKKIPAALTELTNLRATKSQAFRELRREQGIAKGARRFDAQVNKQADLAEIARQKMDLAATKKQPKKYAAAKRDYLKHLRHQRRLLEWARREAKKGGPYWRALTQQILSVDQAIADAKGQAYDPGIDETIDTGTDTDVDVGTDTSTDTGTDTEETGPTADEIAIRDRESLRAFVQTRAGALNAAFGYTGAMSSDLGFTVIVNQNNLVPGSPDVLRQTGAAVAAALGSQGSVTATRETVG